MKITELLVEGRRNPLGLDETKPMIQWIISGEGSVRQESFRIRFSENEDFSTVCYDTGIVRRRSQSWNVEADGILKSCTRYYVRISVSDENRRTCEADDWFETGLFGNLHGAKWIEPEQEEAFAEPECRHIGEVFMPRKEIPVESRLRPMQQLRKIFFLEKKIRSARLYASARGIYTAELNLCPVDDRYFAPEITDYRKRFFYQTYDVTRLLREGENRLDVVLADGWYVGRIGLSGDSCQYGNRLAFWCFLDVQYADGSREQIVSDRSFVSGTGKYRYGDLFIGEMHDLRLAGATQWKPVRELEEDGRLLIGQKRPPIRVKARLKPQRIFTTPKGEVLLDFGKVIAGVVEMRATGAMGTRIQLNFAEQLDVQGNFFDHIAGRNKNQTDVIILAGSGEEWFCPKFTYHGFRYVRVTGYPGELLADAFTGLVLGTELTQTLQFSCSDENLNRLQENLYNSQEGNMVSLPTDCPQREKSGFTGDIQVYGTTGCYNMNLEHFLEDYLREVRDAQEENGEVPNIAPNFPKMRTLQQRTNGCQSSAGWGDACVLLPWILYRMYGNRRVLEENYLTMQRWLDFVHTEAEDGIWRNDTHFGDWLIPSLTKCGMNIPGDMKELRYIVATCYYAKSVDTAAQTAGILGYGKDAAIYRELGAFIRRAFEAAFDVQGRLSVDLQGMYVLSLAFGMVEGEKAQSYAKRLNELVEENDWRLDTGFMSVRYLLKVLKDYGYEETAKRLLYQDQCPSWLYQVKNGATSIWEKWDAVMPDKTVNAVSFNHYSFGCVGEFLYEEIAGIRPLKPGFEQIEIRPDFGFGLKRLSLSYALPGGRIGVSWEQKDDKYCLKIEVPFNAEAVLRLPGKAEADLEAGRYEFQIPCEVEELQ